MTKAPPKIKRRFARSAVLVILGLAAVGLLYLALTPVELTPLRERIEAAILERSTHTIKFDRVFLKALPSLELRLTDVRVMDEGEVLLSASSAHLKVSILSLVRGPVVIEELDINGAAVTVERSPGGEINLVEYVRKHPPRVLVPSISLSDGRLTVTDAFHPERPVFEFTSVNAEAALSAGEVAFYLNAALEPGADLTVRGKFDRGANTFTCGVKARGLELDRLLPYLKSRAPGLRLAGRAGADLRLTRGEEAITAEGSLEYTGLVAAHPALRSGPVRSGSGDAKVAVTRSARGLDLRLTDVDLRMEDFSIDGSLALSGAAGERNLVLNLRTTPAPAISIKGLIPVKALSPAAAARVEDVRPTGGKIAVERLRLRATMREILSGKVLSRPGALVADIALDGLGFTHRGLDVPLSGLKGKVTVESPSLAVKGLSGRFGHGTVKDLNLSVEDMTDGARYGLALEGVFDASDALGAVRMAAGDLAGAITGLDASGAVAVKLTASGSLRDKTLEKIAGSLSFMKTSLTSKSAPLSLTEVNGEADFDRERITFKGLEASDGHSRLKLDGSVEGYSGLFRSRGEGKGEKDAGPGTAPGFDLTAEGVVALETVMGAASWADRGRLAEGLYYDAPVPFRMEAKGRGARISGNLSLDLTPVHFQYRKLARKGKNFPMRLTLAGAADAKTFTVKLARVDFGQSLVVLAGSFGKDLSHYLVAVGSDNVRLADLDDVSPLFKGSFDTRGLLSFNIAGVREGGGMPSYEGGITLSDGEFDSPMLAKPLKEVNATVDFDGNRASIDLDGMKAGTSSVYGKAEILDIAGRSVKFELFAPRFNTADFFRKKKKTGEAGPRHVSAGLGGASGRRGKRLTGSGSIIIKEGNFWNHMVENLYSGVTLEEKTVSFHPVIAIADRGRIEGEVIIYRDRDAPLLWKITSELSDVELEEFFKGLKVRKKILTGATSGSLTLTCRRGAVPGRSCVNGVLTLASPKGKLYELDIFTKIFSLVNIFSLDELLRKGLQYKRLSVDLEFTDGVIGFDDLFLDSDSVRMNAVGDISIVDGSTDVALVMHPFVTLDKIISSIPIAGWVLTGEEKSTISLSFKISGTVKEPVVDPLPVNMMGEKVFGIIQRIIELPMEVIRPGSTRKEKNGRGKKENEE
ncbi:MAG: AsmA-like C-terminal domain-containing protein [Thermodesulfobacteriota bacterium]